MKNKIETLQKLEELFGIDVEKLYQAAEEVARKHLPKEVYKYLLEEEGVSLKVARAVFLTASSRIRENLNIPSCDQEIAIEAIRNAKWDDNLKRVEIELNSPIHLREILDRVALQNTYDYEVLLKIK